MKAITIWQPWASLLAIGAKQYETRSWETKYRGPIAIHAAKKDPCKMPLLGLEAFDEAASEELERAGCGSTWCLLPTGSIIATAELVNCWRIVYHPTFTVPRIPALATGGVLKKGQKGYIEGDGEEAVVPLEKNDGWIDRSTNVDIAKHIPIRAELDVPKKHPDFGRYIVPTEKEMLFGDWTPGRYAWELANVELLTKPIRAKGAQRLWNWDEKDLMIRPKPPTLKKSAEMTISRFDNRDNRISKIQIEQEAAP